MFGKKKVEIVKEEKFQEATGKSIDNEDGWRKLTGNNARDLTSLTQYRMQELAVYLWKTNPLANRLIELPIIYLLADGVKVSAKDDEANQWLKSFWKDPINQMDIKLPKKVREMALFGEQCWPVFANNINGHIRLGYLDPGDIETVVTDPDNIEQAIGIITKKDRKGIAKRYRIIINGDENVFTERTQEIRKTFDTGECFFFRINNLSNSTRGHSDMLSTIDWLDAYDQSLYGELNRWNMLRSFIWDVKMTGATKEDVEARAKEITVPKEAGVRVHNDAEEWAAVTPDLKAVDGTSFSRMFRNHILGGRTIPEHWFGGGGDVNRATATAMGDPTLKAMTFRQNEWLYILECVCDFAIRSRLRAIGLENMADEPDFKANVVFPELDQKDVTVYATAFQQIVIALGSAIDRKLLTKETAVNLLAILVAGLGLKIDPEEELENVLNAEKEEETKDIMPNIDDEEAA
ncbi:MAG: hypothetical protein AB7U85_04885 [Alphaproteobacteria bacterium]